MTKELPNVILELHNMNMEPSNVRKNKGTTKCDKKSIICDIRTTQYKDVIIKCDVLITWYNKFPISGYCAKKKGVR